MSKQEIYISQLQKGDKVYVATDKRPFTVRATDGKRFAICTKPAFGNVLYFIIDAKRGVRSTNNLVFNMYDYTKDEDCDECLKDLNDEKSCVEVSRRRQLDLDIVKIVHP